MVKLLSLNLKWLLKKEIHVLLFKVGKPQKWISHACCKVILVKFLYPLYLHVYYIYMLTVFYMFTVVFMFTAFFHVYIYFISLHVHCILHVFKFYMLSKSLKNHSILKTDTWWNTCVHCKVDKLSVWVYINLEVCSIHPLNQVWHNGTIFIVLYTVIWGKK